MSNLPDTVSLLEIGSFSRVLRKERIEYARGKPIDSCWERVVTKERCVKRNQYDVGFKNLDLTELGVILVTVMAQRQRTGL